MTLKRAVELAALLCLLAGQAPAQEYIDVAGRLSDNDFYRLVACAAPPGGECQKRLVRWSKRDAREISVAIVRIDDGNSTKLQTAIAKALDPTLAALNDSGARLSFQRAKPGEAPDIRIMLLNIPWEGTISGTGYRWLDGSPMQSARFGLGWRGDGTIIDCAIAIGKDTKLASVDRLLIEEITQCMGLMTDIGGSYYERRSIFSETGIGKSSLGDQDRMALRRHYP